MSITAASCNLTHHERRLTELIGSDWAVEAHLQIAHIGWEMDNDYWAIRRADGQIQWAGTDHGSLKLLSEGQMRTDIARGRAQVDLAAAAFAAVHGPEHNSPT